VAGVTSERKREIKSRILELLAQYGRTYDFAQLLSECSDVPKTTFYRWVRQIQATSAPAEEATASARAAIAADVQVLGSEAAVVDRDLQLIAQEMPEVPTAAALTGLNMVQIAGRLRGLLANAAAMKAHSLGADGKIRNPRLYLQASEHERRVLETASRLVEQSYDRNSVEQVFNAIFIRLRQRDPEMVRLVLEDLRALNNGWSMIL
jgi:hypothetical protein